MGSQFQVSTVLSNGGDSVSCQNSDLISKTTEPTYQLPEKKNRGKPRVQYEADLKAKGKYPINNYISLSRLSEPRVHYVKKLADITVPNSVTEALEDPKWKEAMNEEMQALQKNSNSDHTLFLKLDEGKLIALIVYVDDIIVTKNDVEEQLKLQKYLSQEFEMKDLGDLKYFLGIEVPADTPIEMNHKLCEDMDQEPINKEHYQCLVGRLIYLAQTRPDIAYVVSVVSQFMHSPSVPHRNAVDRILRYLKSTPEKGLMFSKNGDLEVVGYTDADWAGSITDRRSTSYYFTFVGGNLVTWQSKKQNVVSWSTA
ncbi:PREDICTED: uncharacterized mitochondrial protein AtMg00810-like [Prunus mume]|uniref:Uncharacterized mitochondrial protein AtMg00810-like n=1 Tax=Prunus mume TaxID=102107 RepID=A0ABM1LUM9_PRUMU|nr:PREDICTED: uncharacterized mitochondrial protein AtMg00810-like [Prunus mume]